MSSVLDADLDCAVAQDDIYGNGLFTVADGISDEFTKYQFMCGDVCSAMALSEKPQEFLTSGARRVVVPRFSTSSFLSCETFPRSSASASILDPRLRRQRLDLPQDCTWREPLDDAAAAGDTAATPVRRATHPTSARHYCKGAVYDRSDWAMLHL